MRGASSKRWSSRIPMLIVSRVDHAAAGGVGRVDVVHGLRSRNSPSMIGVATFTISVNGRNPTAKMPVATHTSVLDGK